MDERTIEKNIKNIMSSEVVEKEVVREYNNKTIEKQNYSLHTCSASDDYLHFVSKDQKDRQSYVTIISGNGNSTVLNGILSFVQGISTIIGSMLLLFPVSGWWIIPMVLLLTVTYLVVENHNKRKFRELFGNTIRDNRKMSYYSGLLTGSAASYELTLFRLSKPFHERMESLNKEIAGQKKKTAWRTSINTMAFRVAYSAVYIGFILLILLGGKIQDAGTIFLVFSITRSIISCATGIGSSVSSVYGEEDWRGYHSRYPFRKGKPVGRGMAEDCGCKRFFQKRKCGRCL